MERDWDVLITTYEICNLEKNALSRFAWQYLIIDEVSGRAPLWNCGTHGTV